MVFSFTAGFFAVLTLILTSQGNVELDPGIAIHHSPSVVIAQKNSPLLLNCSATSSPDKGQVHITWHKNGKPLVTDKRVHILDNGSLYFTEVKKNRRAKNRDHNGFYECFLKNDIGTVIARQVQLIVARISKNFNIEPEDQEVIEGGVARFKCEIDGVPPPIYYWEKDSSPLPRNDRFITLHSGILQIHNVSLLDAGTYHCSAYQSFKKLNNAPDAIDLTWQHSQEAQLKVTTDTNRRPPRIVAITQEVNATIEDSVTLECLADGNPVPTVTWMKDKTPVLKDIFKESYGKSNLRIKEVDKIDAGTYQCIASSSGFPDTVNETKLTVREPPFLIEAPVSVVYPVAQRFRLKCTVNGMPTPVVTWYRNAEKIKPNGRIQIYPDNELLIDSGVGDSGYYQCIARNDVGVVMATARLQITLKENAPKPPGNITITEVTSYRICIKWLASAYPDCCPVHSYTVHYQDLSGAAIFDHKTVTQDKSVCIQNLVPFKQYRFYIRAYSRNAASTQSEIITVRTQESVPSVAPTLRLSSSTPSSIDIEWEPLPKEKCNGNITGYKIFLMNGGQEVIEHVPASNRSYTVRDLRSDTEYKVRVLAGTSVGFPKLKENEWPWLKYKTPKQDEEPRVTARIQVTQLNMTCVEVQWNITDISAIATRYKIYINEVKKNAVKFYIDKSKLSHVICNLESEKFYELMFVVDGPNPNSPLATVEEVFQKIKKDRKPLPPPPLDMFASAITSREISVRWTRPGRQYDIRFYYVQYHKKDNQQNLMYARSDTMEYVLTDLEPYTLYSIRVRSHTLHEHGIFSDAVEMRTKEDVPSAPLKLFIRRTDKETVQLEWAPPTNQNGVIISYIILYHQHSEDPETFWSTIEKDGSVTSTSINGINEEHNYFFKIRACTRQGKGHVSQTVKVKPWICKIHCIEQTGGGQKADNSDTGIMKDQRLGIIIGCSIGLSSIIICIVVVVVRHRHYSRMYMNHQVITGNQGNRYVGQYLSSQNGKSPYHVIDEDSQLPMIQENVNSDAKGPDNTLKFPGNGKVIYFCNGNAPNGKIRAYVASPISNGHPSEQMALITSRSAQAMSGNPQDLSHNVTHSHSEGDVPQKNEDRKSSGNINDIANTTSKLCLPLGTSQAIGASGQNMGSHGNHDLTDSGDLISKMLQATTSNTDCSDKNFTLPQRSGSKLCITTETTDLLSVDA